MQDVSLAWTKAFHSAGALLNIDNARGFWGASKGDGGYLVCSVWSDQRMRAYIPRVNKGNYREAALAAVVGDLVHVIVRDREKETGTLLPTLHCVQRVMREDDPEHLGYLELSHTSLRLSV